MRITILPKKALGWWSVGLAILFIFFLVAPVFSVLRLGGVARQIGLSPGQLKGVVFLIAGISSLITGLISIIKSKERSILVFLAMLIGFVAVAFVLGEILFPH